MARIFQPRSVVADFAFTAAATLLVVGLLTYALSYVSFSRALEGQLQEEAETLSASLAAALADHIWNMDGDSIREYMQVYPQATGLEKIRVTSEFDDLVYAEPGSDNTDVLDHVHEVYRNGQHIGNIYISLSRRGIRVVQRAIAYSSFLVIGLGSLLVLGTMVLRQGVVIGAGLSQLLDGMQRIADGDYEHRLHHATHREFRDLNSQINRMAGQIQAHTAKLRDEIAQRREAEQKLIHLADSLEDEVATRTRELVEANSRLQQQIAERRKAEAEILAVSGREQQRLGRDLHDSLGQQLVGISFLSKSLASELQKTSPENAELASHIGRLVREAVAQTRQMAHGLYPVGMPGSNVKDALEDLGHHVEDLFGIRCEVACEGSPEVDPDAAMHLYRIAQEAVSNARLHGKAKHVRIALARNNGVWQLTIADDGTGLEDVSGSDGGMGVKIMRYRTEAVHGVFSISRNGDGGALVSVSLPIQ